MSRIVIESIDGAGKSTTAQETASILSQEYPASYIKVVDSTGVYGYRAGELAEHQWPWLDSLEPHQSKRLVGAAKLGAFTLARRAAESWMSYSADLVIGVRDPFRIDPATYALVFGPHSVQKMSSEARLRMFNRLTHAPHPDLIVHLDSDKYDATSNIGQRLNPDSHETNEKLKIIANELPLVLSGYSRLYGATVAEIRGLTASTSQETAARVEPFLPNRSTSIYLPAALGSSAYH